MERIIKFLVLLFLIFIPCLPVISAPAAQTSQQQAVLADCVKTFPVGFEKVYYLTLSAVNEYNYTINEIQTKSGYIVFTTNTKRKFLASIVYVSSSKSMLKITPFDGVYNFACEIPQKIFKYIELNQSKNF